LKGRLTEAIRDISNATITLNPIVRYGLDRAAVIFVRTADTKALLTPSMRRKTRIMMELGVPPSDIGAPRITRQSPARLLFAGRLLYWKGVHIAVEALALLCRKLPETRLTIVGSGPEESRLRADVAARGLQRQVDFVAWMPQQEFLRLYAVHDLFVFPSLHDSAGWVVLESLCQGVPVVCLDLGGPKEIVTQASGLIISTAGRSTHDVAASMAERLHDVLVSPAQLAELSAGAVARAHDFLLSNQVVSLYEQAREYMQGLRQPGGQERQAAAEAGNVMGRT
jgi:glycosyltransferase involved in cell wall biosynthesis